jgi:hypothetical protein
MAKNNFRSQKTNSPARPSYLTKRVLGRAIGKATKHTAEEALHLRGYVLVAERGWVVKVDRNGKKTRVSRLSPIQIPKHIVLD